VVCLNLRMFAPFRSESELQFRTRYIVAMSMGRRPDG